MRRAVHSSEHRHGPLTDGRVEVVVVRNGGDPKAGVVLGRRVGPIAVPSVLGNTRLSLICQFGCLFVLTLYTAHYLDSDWRRGKRTIVYAKSYK